MKKILFWLIFTSFGVVLTFLYYGARRDVLLISGIHSGISPQEAKSRLGLREWKTIDKSTGRDGISEVTTTAEPYSYLGCRGKVTMCFIGDKLYMVFFFPLDHPQLCQRKIAKSLSLKNGLLEEGDLKIEQSNSFKDGTYTLWTDKRLFNDYVAWITRNG